MNSRGNAETDARAPAESWLRRHGVKLIASLAVAGGFAWLLHRGALPLAPDKK